VRKACCVLTVALLLIGCGGGESTETVPFKATDTSQFESMKNAMMKNVQTKNYKGVAPEKTAK